MFLTTYSKKLNDCAGHFGYVQLHLPVFHAGFFKHTLTILQCICKKCSGILLPASERDGYLRKLRNPRTDALARAATFKKIVDKCKRSGVCLRCGAVNGNSSHLIATSPLILIQVS